MLMPALHAQQTADATMPACVIRQLAVVLGVVWLVWLFALMLGASVGPAVYAQPGYSASWQTAPDQAEPMLLQTQPERSSAQLFLHPKQQPLYVLVAEPVPLLLRVLALLLTVVSVLAWFIRAGPRRSFRLGLWRDANLCCKQQLYQ